ncbi:MAG: single-stranded DNA-binding protein [Nostocoides sp.]
MAQGRVRADHGDAVQNNIVHLQGRVSAVDEPRQLPSGDAVVTFRVIVRRPASRSRNRPKDDLAPRTQVDTIDVACWSATTRRTAGRLGAGDVVEVDGALRRRFFRAGGGAASRYEVEAHRVKRVSA